MSIHFRMSLLAAASATSFSLATLASAQTAAPSGWSTEPQAGWAAPSGVQPPPYSVPFTSKRDASDGEVGALYGVSAGYGIGLGIWLDAEFKIEDPGLRLLPPAILGVAAPVSVFFLDRPRMPRGMPAAIAAGMAIGAGEGVGLASYQFVRSKAEDEWGFRGFARSVFIGSTAGAVLGYVAAVSLEPSPKTSLLMGSGVGFGTVVGSLLGYGASSAGSEFGAANDAASLGGLVGYNVGLVGAAALSTVWVPTYESLSWMWIGFGAGLAVSSPVYLFYAGGDHEWRRGMIVQGTVATLGLAAGAIFTIDSRDVGRRDSSRDAVAKTSPRAIEVTGGGLLPVPGGMGLQISGTLF